MRHSIDVEPARFLCLIWLAALLVWDDPMRFARYRERLGISMYAFRRDIRAVNRVIRCLEEYIYIQGAMLVYLWLTELK